ncbi:MAG: LamG-like jellyroll fold domain-containing protein [Bacteroidales bacterium]
MKTLFRTLQFVVMGALLSGTFLLTSCKDDNDGPKDDGKVDPGTVASTNLVAYFPFEDNGNDAVGSLVPSSSPNVSYVAGRRNKAYQGAENGYFMYDLPTGSKLKDLKAFSIAMWFYCPPALDGVPPVPGIWQINGTSDAVWGNMCLTLDRMPEAADSLNIKMVFHKEGVGWANQFVGFSNPAFIENKWFHVIFSYDNVASKYMVYVNGTPLTLSDGITNRYESDAVPPVALGDLAFVDASKLCIGAWMEKALGNRNDEWMGWFTGKIDELRVYDKGLSSTEAKALFDAEVTQLTEE